MKEEFRPRSPIVTTLVERGFVHQATDLAGLDALACKGPIGAYIGFDLTAPALHVGSLVQIMVVRHLRTHGHDPVVLFGDATTRVGDPSDKNGARPVLTRREIETNRLGIVEIIDRIVGSCRHVHNSDWLDGLSFMDFLQGPARELTLNRMLSMDIVSRRIDNNLPMTMMELCYSMMQGMDFTELARREGVRLQIGGSDQWSNILVGMDLARRMDGTELFGLTTPLLLDSQGRKMGKTAEGKAIWLDADLTSPFDLWQFFRNVPDELVPQFLGLFTTFPMDEVRRLAAIRGQDVNEVKKLLADEAVSIVHGTVAAVQARAGAEAAFGSGSSVARIPTIDMARNATLTAALMEAGFATSKADARRLAQGGGVRIDGEQRQDVDMLVSDAATADTFRLSAGKKRVVLVRVLPDA